MVSSRRSPLRRLGCGIAVVIWFLILLTPCFCFALATQGEIAIRLGDAPEQSFRVWLLSEENERGLGISRPSVSERDELVCVQTDVNFVLWMGQSDSSTFCDCYNRATDATDWSLVSSQPGNC
jgi:hypothetical protein